MLGVRNFYLYFLSADDGCNMYLDFFRNNTKLDVDLHSQIVKLMSMEKEKFFCINCSPEKNHDVRK